MSESQAEAVLILSRRLVRPSKPPTAVEPHSRQINLNPWDLHMLSVDYIQKGLLFPPPNPDDIDSIIPRLLSSFSQTLDLFYPFSGRLATVHHPTSPPSSSILLDLNNSGAEFINASAAHLTASDFTSSLFIPPAVRSLFPLNGVINHDGHSFPLLAVQVNVLGDGSLFLACSLNHTVADGASLWFFFNTWSALTRSAVDAGDVALPLPVVEHWFLPSTPPPILLPFRYESEFIRRVLIEPRRECFFQFSRQAVAGLKAKANEEMGVTNISSLQALLAHMWRAATRARALEPHVETTYMLVVGHRRRVKPPLPDTYIGNTALVIPAKARAGELVENGLGWAAWQLNRVVASATKENAIKWLEEWVKKPEMMRLWTIGGTRLATGSSPRFDVFGNDFGWGSPTAVRSGDGNKVDGKVTVYPGREGEGSMALEVFLSGEAPDALLEDKEFMEAVGSGSIF